MNVYKTINGKKGLRYLKNGKLVAMSQIPEEVVEKLKTDASVEVEPPSPPRVCIFCGIQSNLTRFVNMRTVVLCEEHYYSTNIGKIAQKLKETQDG